MLDGDRVIVCDTVGDLVETRVDGIPVREMLILRVNDLVCDLVET